MESQLYCFLCFMWGWFAINHPSSWKEQWKSFHSSRSWWNRLVSWNIAFLIPSQQFTYLDQCLGLGSCKSGPGDNDQPRSDWCTQRAQVKAEEWKGRENRGHMCAGYHRGPLGINPSADLLEGWAGWASFSSFLSLIAWALLLGALPSWHF